MPRRRPGHIRAGLPRRRRAQHTAPGTDCLSPRALSEIVRLERTRNYLRPGDVAKAVRLWGDYVHRPERELWHDYEWGNVHWYCCGNPLEARVLLDAVTRAMSHRGARELRDVISKLDAFWAPPPASTAGR